MIIVQDNPGALPLALYLKDLHYIESPVVHRVTAIDVVAVAPHRGLGGFCWWGSECNLVPSRLDRDYASPASTSSRRLRVEDFRVLELRATKPTTVVRATTPGRDWRTSVGTSSARVTASCRTRNSSSSTSYPAGPPGT